MLAGVGILIGVAYTLRAVQKAFFPPDDSARDAVERVPTSPAHAHPMDAITVPERIGAALLMSCTLLIGLYPKLLLDLIRPALESPLMSALVKGGQP